MKEQKSELERIKKLPLVRLENGQHVCAGNELVFFPPDTDEDRKEIEPLFKELPIFQSILLEGEERSDIEAFLDNLGVRALRPEKMIDKWIIPQYSKSDKPSKQENLSHVHYLFKVWDKLSGSEHRNLKKEISETPVLWVFNGVQPEIYGFVKSCDAYLPKAYTGDMNLEIYFSVYNSEVWFVDDAYLDSNPNSKEWRKFLRSIGAMDAPQVIKKNIPAKYGNHQEFDKELDKRNIKLKRSTWIPQTNIEDFYLHGLSEVLAKISEDKKVNLSRVLWCLLVKVLPSEEKMRNAFFQGIYHRFYYSSRSDPFEATFYRQLKEVPWLPDEQGNFHLPSGCFASTDSNRKVLGDSVAYLHPNFDISQDNEDARWLANRLGVHLNADTNSVFNYLQTLSGTKASVEKVEPLYRFLARQDARRSEEFKQKPLIFVPNPKSSWWQADKVFWDDESPVFGDGRGYLKTHYSENLEFFFKASGVRDRATPLDYVRRIQEIASVEKAEDAKVRERVKILYGRLWQSLQGGGSWQEDEEWQREWKRTREGKYWLGKKGDEWDFFFFHKLVWKDDDYRSRLFKDKIPFWVFNGNLLEFAKDLGVKGCYQASDVKFSYYGDQGEYKIWSKKVRNLRPYIHDFLNSPVLCEERGEENPAEVLDRLSVCRAQTLEIRYKWKEGSVTDPSPRLSFLGPTEPNQKVTLWLGLEADEGAYPDLIGDALQDHFGINQLREFSKDLLLTTPPYKTTLLNWKHRGFQPNLCVLPLEIGSKEGDEDPSESVDERPSGETDSKDDSGTNDSGVETPTVHEDPETGNEDSDSTGDESETPTHRPRSGRGGARRRGGSGSSKPNRNGGTGYGGGGGGGEGEEHRTLKEHLADNPSLFGEGLELIDTEYRFGSGDEADILFEDSSGNPVTVEVKPPILSGSDQKVWQAVKYKHLAAVEYGLPCEQVRSILAAPKIPDDVKTECKKLGIEPCEVHHQGKNANE